VNVAAVDHDRILTAAAAALKQEPVSITTVRAKLSEGGPHRFLFQRRLLVAQPENNERPAHVQRDGPDDTRRISPRTARLSAS